MSEWPSPAGQGPTIIRGIFGKVYHLFPPSVHFSFYSTSLPAHQQAPTTVVMAAQRTQPACKYELDNLVDIKIHSDTDPEEVRHTKHVLKEALVEWKEQVQALEAKVEKRTKRNDQLANETYQFVGLYSVFVGVVFTAVLQSTRVKCEHIWSPVVLCLLAYCIISFVTVKKFGEIRRNRVTIKQDDGFRKLGVENIRNLKLKGLSRFDFCQDVLEPIANAGEKESEKTVSDSSSSTIGWITWIIVILTFFTVVLLVSFVHILCINTSNQCLCSSNPS